ncbi:hypothetical protein LTV02_26925 [Nocardia yamanashiensis]|uniref:hypothetical protein n=1 Tax=Nocardia yamanashiensis TaxID=209247 RepID=UPI001E55B34F|nr:hypothetical protein [Nocardia yamanashiensis]UGT39675.1 hypothetical protein LTV02_26925 [Nocardia yamanashiensis]
MAPEVKVDIPGLRGVATSLEGISTDVANILSTLEAAVQAGNGCWGDDEHGHNFSKGQNGYETREPKLVESLQSKVSHIKECATTLSGAATSLEKTDIDSGTQF